MAVGELEPVVEAATGGDADAWNRLVERFAGLVWATARGQGLSPTDAADVCQTTWLRLAEHIGRIRDADRIGLWLVTTTRHEALRVLRSAQRTSPAELPPVAAEQPAVDDGLLAEERSRALWEAFEALSQPCKLLLRLLIAEPPPSYAEVSVLLDMPIGSIGPTRNRCLAALRRSAALTRVVEGDPPTRHGGSRNGTARDD